MTRRTASGADAMRPREVLATHSMRRVHDELCSAYWAIERFTPSALGAKLSCMETFCTRPARRTRESLLAYVVESAVLVLARGDADVPATVAGASAPAV